MTLGESWCRRIGDWRYGKLCESWWNKICRPSGHSGHPSREAEVIKLSRAEVKMDSPGRSFMTSLPGRPSKSHCGNVLTPACGSCSKWELSVVTQHIILV